MAKKPTTKKKPTKKPVKNKTSEADFLTSLALAPEEEGKKKKSGTPVVEDATLEEALKDYAEACVKIKEYGLVKTECAQEIFPRAREARLRLCRQEGAYLSSVKMSVSGWAAAITVTEKNAYSGIDISQKPAAVQKVAETLELDDEAAEVELDNRLNWSTSVSLSHKAFKDPKAMAAIKKYLPQYLVVKITAKPTEDFHQQSVLQEDEGKLMEALKDLLRPHSPAGRLSER